MSGWWSVAGIAFLVLGVAGMVLVALALLPPDFDREGRE